MCVHILVALNDFGSCPKCIRGVLTSINFNPFFWDLLVFTLNRHKNPQKLLLLEIGHLSLSVKILWVNTFIKSFDTLRDYLPKLLMMNGQPDKK